MKGKGLTLEMIAETASRLVEEKGYNKFSVRELALRLNVKAASLYNHIDSVEDINREVGRLAMNKLNDPLERATEGKRRDEALEALAYAYAQFVKEDYELYRAIIGLPTLDPAKGEELGEIGRQGLRVVRNTVHQYAVDEADAVHFSRCLRSALHGFAVLESAGYNTGRGVRTDESFRFLIRGYIAWIHSLEENAQRGVGEEKET